MENIRDRWRQSVALLAALAIVATACGSDGGEPGQVESAVVAVSGDEPDSAELDEGGLVESDPAPTAAAEVDEPSPGDDEEEEPLVGPAQLELGPPDWDELTEWNLPAMGGVTFGVPGGYHVLHDGDMVQIRKGSDLGTGSEVPTMVISRTHHTPAGVPVTASDMTNSAIAGIGTAAPTNTTLSLFGEELQGWQFTANAGAESPTFSAYPAGIAGPTVWNPFPMAEIYLGDVPGGVLAVGWSGEDREQVDEARELFDRVAPTLSLARSFDETTDPVTPVAAANPEPPLEPAALPDGWPAEMKAVSAAIEPGEYSQLGFGTAFSYTIADGWFVQPNLPGWLVLTGPASLGPGDRGIVFRSGATGLIPALRSGAAGEELPLDLAGYVEDPPENIEIDASGEVEIGGATGFRIRFRFDESADCAAGAVCEYFLMTKYPYPPASMRKGYEFELIHLTGGLVEPLTILVETYDDRWFDRAEDLLDTIEFDVSN